LTTKATRNGKKRWDVQVDAATAWKIADLIDQTVERMKPGDRLLGDLSITDKPEKQVVFKTPEDVAEGCSASREWLKEFSEFSRDSEDLGSSRLS